MLLVVAIDSEEQRILGSWIMDHFTLRLVRSTFLGLETSVF